MQHYSHLATATNILWKLIEANGHEPDALYREVGINPNLLNQPGARVPYLLVNQLWEKASENWASRIKAPFHGLSNDGKAYLRVKPGSTDR